MKLISHAEAKELYKTELEEIYGIENIGFGSSRLYIRGGALIEQKLIITIDEKGNKPAIEFLKTEGFEVERKQKKGRRTRIGGTWGNGEGYEVTLSLQVIPEEDSSK